MPRSLTLPHLYSIQGKISGNPIEQIRVAARQLPLDGNAVTWPGGAGQIVNVPRLGDLLVSPRTTQVSGYGNVVVWPGLEDSTRQEEPRWIRPRPAVPDTAAVEAAIASWTGAFSFIQEREVNGHERSGLRRPQVGALHAVLAHWTVARGLGTVVMPTGTGKTETMVALLVSEQIDRLLVIAPTSALRAQIAEKFATLGLLKQIGQADNGSPRAVVRPGALYPVVGRLESALSTVAEAAEFARSCNVVVATVQAITQCTAEVQAAFAGEFSHLFIDEAHHAAARTWDWFRYHFIAEQKPVLQFTATPYRRDGKHIGGRIIFDYPLKQAQDEGYFRPISFRSIWEYNTERADGAIAKVAIEQLDEDLAAGHDHIVMARADSKEAAEQLADVYRRLAPRHNPVYIHSDISPAEQRNRLAALFEGQSRIVCCVNMLGEGFDLPRLKIAALHDVHKSLAITIQFTGRFTRKGIGVGNATVIANLADAKVEEALEDLYAEDPDWNEILVEKSKGETQKQRERTEFVESFGSNLELPIQNFQPKMSTVAYRTHCPKWRPGRLQEYLKKENLVLPPTISHKHRTAVFVVRTALPTDWANVREIQNVEHDLYLLHWSEDQRILYINSTNNGSLHRPLAEAVAGADVELIHGENIYRALAGVHRAILSNVGLKHSFSKAVQFSMHVGTDIANALSDAQTQKRMKTNLFARGFENGAPTTVGCSHKGRVWSFQIAESMAAWVEWATAMGARLIDESIVVEDLLKKVIKPVRITNYPEGRVPLTIEWSEYFSLRDEASVWVQAGETEVPFYEAEMEITQFDDRGPVRFAVLTPTARVEYEMRLAKGGASFIPIGGEEASLRVSGRKRPLSAWFQDEAPVIRFDNNAFLVGDLWYEPSHDDRAPFDPNSIEVWDWSRVDIKKESKRKTDATTRTVTVIPDSIQTHVLKVLQSDAWPEDYDIIFDDDDTGEAADIVAMKIAAGDRLIVHLFHLKYSSGESQKAGSRVGDLYEVCGQAQRSIVWKYPLQRLFDHLHNRESKRQTDYGGETRFEKGSAADLARMEKKARVLELDFGVFIVQPGLSKARVTENQLDLLGATETYLIDTYAVPLRVIAST